MNISDVLKIRPKPEAYKAKKHDDLISKSTVVQTKLDGWRMTIFRNEDVHVIGRKRYINHWDLLKYHPVSEKILALPQGTVLDGEFHDPAGVGTDVPTLMRSGGGGFTPWAIPWYAGVCLLNTDLQEINSRLCDLGWEPPGSHPHMSVEDLMVQAEVHGIEGFVLKTCHWDGWIKVKPTKTFDLLVTGFEWGTSKNEGKIGSLCVSDTNGEVGKVGGLTDEIRDTPYADLAHKVVEVRAQGVTKDKRLQFARLVRFRDDKDEIDTL